MQYINRSSVSDMVSGKGEKALKILVCARGYNSGSENNIGNFELDQAKALKAAGCDVRIASLDLRSPRRRRPLRIKKFALEKMRCVTANYFASILPGPLEDKMGRHAAKKAFEYICKDGWKPDVIHAHFTEIANAFADVANSSGAKFVITEHSSLMNSATSDLKSLRQAKYSYPKADRVIAVSSVLAHNIEKNVGVHTCVIGNVLDAASFNKPAKGSTDNIFRFVSCGNLVEIKRFDVLLKAFEKLEDRSAQLTIFGDGVLEAQLRSLAASLGLDSRVFFKGRQPRDVLAKEYEKSDAFVLASRSETFGVAFIEAMSMGLPVIATKCGGPQDYVNESNGRLAEVNDPDSLAQQMSFVMNNKDKFDSKLIIEGIIDKYSPKSIARQLVDLYKGL